MLSRLHLDLALDFSLQPSRGGRPVRASERHLLFCALVVLSLVGGSKIRRVSLREPLLVILRAPYRYKLSRHQFSVSRQRFVVGLDV